MGLLLRPDAHYAASPEGTYILTNRGPIAFTGRSVHQLLDRLAPYLDGRFTLADLTADLSAERRELVRKFVEALLEHGAVREVGEDQPGDLGVDAPAQPEIRFLGYFNDSPRQLFEHYCDSTALVVGDGPLLAAVARAAARSGLRQVRVLAMTDDGDDEPAVRALLDGVDLLFHVTSRPLDGPARLLDRLAAEKPVRTAQAVLWGASAWLGLTGTVPADGASRTSGWRRLTARRSAPIPRDPTAPANPSGATLTAVANRLVHGVFAAVTGSGGGWQHRMHEIELSTPRSQSHAFLPHPLTTAAEPRSAAEFLDRVTALQRDPGLEQEAFSQRAVACLGDRVGVLGEPTEGEFTQVPLHVCEMEVSDPVGLLRGQRAAVTGAGLGFAAARYQAARRAFALYGSLMVDPRRLIGADGRGLAGLEDGPDRALHALTTGRLAGFAWGYGLQDHQALPIDAVVAFPSLRGPSLTVPATAAAYSWRGAVEEGLVDHCRRLTVDELTTSTEPFPRLDLAGTALDARGDRYRALLEVIGEPVTVYDVTGSLGVPTMVGYLRSTPAGCAAGLSAADALRDTLEQVLLSYQARTDPAATYAPVPAPAVPPGLRGAVTRPLPDVPRRTAGAVVAALAERGLRAVAVPLDHDPEVSAIMPYCVHVVLSDA